MPVAFVRALVTDVLMNPSQVEIPRRKTMSEYASKVAGDENLKNLPRNSLAVKILSNAESKNNGGDEGEVICYPFFSSHLSMPVKPGEEVWVMFEEYDPPGRSAIGYWISRVHGPRHVEDVNYSYNRRTYKTSTSSASTKKRTSDKFSERESTTNNEPGSPTQLDSTGSPTTNPTEIIELLQYAGGVHRFDAIPRYTKRPGDLILQGSNNSLVMLGEERGFSGLNEPTISASELDVLSGKPAIDIVVGRKMNESARTTRMELLYPEIDKRVGDDESPNEGDANFASDSSRIYVTAASDDITGPDSLLSLIAPDDAFAETDNKKKRLGSFIVAKSDNLRMVSRSDIKIVKEPPKSPPEKTDEGAAIIMNDNGYLQVAGTKIIMSKYVGGNASQPYIRLDKLSDFLSSLISRQSDLTEQVIQLSNLLATYSTAVGGSAPQTAPAGAQLNLSLVSVNSNLLSVSNLLRDYEIRVSEFKRRETLGSTVIYGE